MYDPLDEWDSIEEWPIIVVKKAHSPVQALNFAAQLLDKHYPTWEITTVRFVSDDETPTTWEATVYSETPPEPFTYSVD